MSRPPAHLGVLGPITVADYREHLFAREWRDDLPAGDGGTPVNLLCRELLARGHRLTVFTAVAGTDRELVLEGPRLRLCMAPLRRGEGQRPARDFFASERRALVAAIRRERPDVLHAHWTTFYALAAQASGLPVVVTAHDATLHVLRRAFTPYRIAHALMAYAVTSRAPNVVAVSPYVARHLKRYMLYRGPSTVIPNGLPDAVFRLADRRRDREPATFASVLTGWTDLKNGKALLKAFAEVREDLPRARLVLMGHGHGPGGPAERWARERSLEAGVEFVGQVPHGVALARLADDVDVYVHPSLEESFSMAVAEASAVGLPSIAGERSGGVPYVLDGGRAGLLVDVGNPREIAAAMKRLTRDRQLRIDLAAAARAHARRTFRIEAVADAYLDLYARLAGSERAS